jgi:hypothetical protein
MKNFVSTLFSLILIFSLSNAQTVSSGFADVGKDKIFYEAAERR